MFKLPRLPFQNFNQYSPFNYLVGEKGIAPLFILILLFVAIFAGTYLVQNRINIMPFAAESSECGIKIDDDWCIKKGIPSHAYKVPTGGYSGVTRPIADQSLCNNSCSTGEYCGQSVILNPTGGNHKPIAYRCISQTGKTYSTKEEAKKGYTEELAEVWKNSEDGEFFDYPQFTVVQNSECNDQCSGNKKCYSIFIPAKANAPQRNGYPIPNFYSFMCIPQNSLSGIPNTMVNSVSAKSAGDTTPTVNSPVSDYSQYKTVLDCTRVIPNKPTYCTDAGRLVNESTVWEKDPAEGTTGVEKCRPKITDVKACTASDEYKNGKKYVIPAGQAASDIVGENKPIADGKVAPEVEKLAADCGFIQADQSTLGIPFFKIATGQNTSVTREDCKQLLATQLTYFEQANIRAKNKLEETAKDLGVEIKRNDDGTYVVDAKDKAVLETEAGKELVKNVETISNAQKTLNECKDKTGEAQAACLGETQKATQAAAVVIDKAALTSTLAKLELILTGQRNGGCVKADLGVTPSLEAKRLKSSGVDAANPKGRRTFHRLLVCSGGDKGDLKYRVLVGGLATGETATVTKPDGTTGTATNTTGTKDGDKCEDGGAKDCGNDAERLYGLHGTTDDATGPPQYGAGFKINECVTLHGQDNADMIRTDLAIYIEAAKNGTQPKSAAGGPCRAEPNPNDTGGNGSSRDPLRNPASKQSGSTPTGGTTPTGGSTTAPKTEDPSKPGTDGGKTNKCTTDPGCQEKNDPLKRKGTYKCDPKNGQCYLAS